MKAKKFHVCDFCGQRIELGEKYSNQFNRQSEGVYTWKSHIRCNEIASKLKMFDEADEGVTADDFYEHIKNEFMEVMSEDHNEIYESKSYKIPPFVEQLNFVINHHTTPELLNPSNK